LLKFGQMRVTFWGTRGSVPTPGPTTVRYGGNTACVELRTDAGTFFIFDSGTGIRELGLKLARQGGPVNAHLMLGHTHWDHISGFPFFTPVFVPGNRLTIYGARDLDRSLRDVLAGQMHYTYFPVPLGDLRAEMTFSELEEGKIHVEDATVRTHYLNHTAVTMGYRVEADGASVAYITDHEPYGLVEDGLRRGFIHGGDRRLIEFVRGVDLLIQDAQYTPDEYAARRGWGHGSTDYVVDVAVEAGVRRLAMFHHEPTHSDAEIDRMLGLSQARARAADSPIEIFGATEGETINL
jgi:phosphoribosyl 1,2-cyclic phosphodiesterase